MESDRTIIYAITLSFVTLVLSLASCQMYTVKKFAESPNPLEAACAAGSSTNACLSIREAP